MSKHTGENEIVFPTDIKTARISGSINKQDRVQSVYDCSNHRLRHYKSKTENVRTRRVPVECVIKELGVIDP